MKPGVAHLANTVLEHLNVHISEQDRNCVAIAGLCHDLG